MQPYIGTEQHKTQSGIVRLESPPARTINYHLMLCFLIHSYSAKLQTISLPTHRENLDSICNSVDRLHMIRDGASI